MIQILDLKLKTALENLKKNLNFTWKLAELEKPEITVQIVAASTTGSSTTEVLDDEYKTYLILINCKADDALAKQKWGICGTTEENSLAHELGHVYWYYLRHVIKKTNMLDGKPSSVSEDDWDEIMGETMARRFDTLSRPAGTTIPVRTPTEETVLERLDFTPFPFSLFK
jgi:hypothetical protein